MIDMTWISAFFLGAGCIALGYLIGARNSARLFISSRVAKDTDVTPNGKKRNQIKQALEIEKLADILDDFKMVLVVRNDLKMGKGKIAAQCSHATLGLYKKILHRAPKALNRWELCGQVKVVVKIESQDDMLVLQVITLRNLVVQAGFEYLHYLLMHRSFIVERAKSLNLPTHVTIDAGRTQIAPNSRTVMAILGPAEMVDDVTGGLKLL